MSKLIITLDPHCCRCSLKIQKILTCLQGEFCIAKIEYEKDKVIVSGPFDAEKLSCKIWCKAGKIIINIEIEEKKKEQKPPTPPPAPIPIINIEIDHKSDPKPDPPSKVLIPYPLPYPYPFPVCSSKQCNCSPPYCRCHHKPKPPPCPDSKPHCPPAICYPPTVPWSNCKIVCEENPPPGCFFL